MVARFRPQNKAELALGGESIVDFETEDTCNINVRADDVDAITSFGRQMTAGPWVQGETR